MSKGKILVIRGGAMGDFILTFPVFAALRTQFPDTRLEVIGYPQVASLAVAGGLVDALRPIDSRPLAGFFARGGDLDFELSSYFAGFNVIFTYLFDPDEIFRTNLGRITKAQIIQGPHRPDDSSAWHATDQLLQPLQRLAIFDADPQPRLKVPSDSIPVPKPTLAVHPGSSTEHKNWPEARWLDLLTRLLDQTDLSLLLLGGEAEGERLERLSRSLPPERVSRSRSVPLPDLAVQMQRCVGFIGHDSGPTHLAAALGLPGLALWGPTEPKVWRPRSDRFSLLTGTPDLTHLSVDAVVAKLQTHLPKWLA